MEELFGLLAVAAVVFAAFVTMFRQWHSVWGCLGQTLGGAASSIGGCIGIIIVVLVVGRIFVGGLVGGCRPADPPPTVSLFVDPVPPVEVGTRLTLTAASSSKIAGYSFSVKDEAGGLTPLPERTRRETREWTPSQPGNYVLVLSAQSSKGTIADVRQPVYVAPANLSPPCDDLTVKLGCGGDWFEGKLHLGVDLLWERLDKPRVMAVAHGQVKHVGSFGDGWGRVVMIEHQYQGAPVVAVYGHIIPREDLGKDVTKGEIVGWVDPAMNGNGKSSPHLHFGIFGGPYSAFPRRDWGGIEPGQYPGGWLNPMDVISAPVSHESDTNAR